MASIEIKEVPKHVSFEEVQVALARAAEALNAKRAIHGAKCFATVRVGEVLVHPMTRARCVVASFSDHDKKAPKYLARAWGRLLQVGKDREAALHKVEARWYFVKGDLCLS